MRARLFVVFLVPLTCILLVLGGAYAWSMNRSIQQEFSNQQAGDLSYFATGARHALRASNPDIVQNEMNRYGELYRAQVAVIDRSGAVWASGGSPKLALDDSTSTQVALALSGRRSEVLPPVWPWSLGDAVTAEPIFDDGSVIGAVVISASTEVPRGQIFMRWGQLIAVAVTIVAVLVVVVMRLSTWVLKPLRRVDEAMAAIEHGEMDARIADDTGPPEMRRIIQVFNRMADQIERVMTRQQEFVMNASHELRNPLGALALRVESLATGLDESWEPDIEKTREEGRRMTRILDTLLANAQSVKRDAPFAAVDLVEVAADRLSAWEQIAEGKRVSLVLGGSAQVLCLTDRTAIESAFDAVLDNALKFAPAGTSIEVHVHETDVCEITIRDHGPGLAPDELERVTDRFWRSPRDQNVPGSGLGLAIATDLLASLNGQVRLAAAPGGGLAVSLQLPGGAS